MPAIATGYCFARAPPRRFFLAGGPLALGFVAVVVEVEGETTGDGKVLRASHLAARAARSAELGYALVLALVRRSFPSS